MSVSYWERFWWVFFHLSKGDPSSGSVVAASLWMTRRKPYCFLQYHQPYGNWRRHDLMCECVRPLHLKKSFFFVPIPDTVFRLRGACWQVALMMCWKAIKWGKRMTNLWWQKQSEGQRAWPILIYPTHQSLTLRDESRAGKGSWMREGNKMMHWCKTKWKKTFKISWELVNNNCRLKVLQSWNQWWK